MGKRGALVGPEPWIPREERKSYPPGLPEAQNRTKMLFKFTRQKLLRDRCGPEAHKDAGSVAGLEALAPVKIY